MTVGVLPCTKKGFHEIRTGGALPVKKKILTVYCMLCERR